MAAFRDNPDNPNQIYVDKFKFVLNDLPHVRYFCSAVNLPGITMQEIELPNPLNRLYYGSTKLYYDNMNLTFRVDEDLQNYREIFNWMVGITAPQSTDQFKEFTEVTNRGIGPKVGYNIYRDSTLVTLTNVSNVNLKVFFKDIFPISLTGLEFGVENKTVTTATATFRYNWYEFEAS